ncbi:2'-5' RNA ligase [Methanosalsum zhilinae DSM 4017]|uniref:RNA 2',3'-cyclic phosphodiesterase n=1 Tax=Methanosalsum zhilinae (strain DSM 4017 / NBRC 107636 / OCM 62 / WeN5) TaxID=679901 RepID=F7XPG7_METZD|nr:RNA 2',3'-cyclic phosphodiesterase [Methanosalsum zhilinae]AEH60296.1 2'-5' RNA ligase [Methanosalsum zhilinae DSM 4017]
MVRVFISVDIPQNMADKISQVQSYFSDFNFKFVDPLQVHLTLKFLGDVDDKLIPDIAEALDNINYEPFEARITGLGVFPKPSYAKVIWIGAEGGFEGLHREVESCLKDLNFKRDKKEFTAHLTIARVKFMPKSKKENFLKLFNELKDVDIGTMSVNSVYLKKSTLTPDGPVYETLHEVHLGDM